MFLEKHPPLAKTWAEQLSGLPRSKQFPKTARCYRGISSDINTVTIPQYSILNTVSIDQLIPTPKTGIASGRIGSQTYQTDGDANGEQVKRNRQLQEYVFEKIVGHTNKKIQVHYIVRWFGYGKLDDTTEPPEHLSEHL